MTTRVQHTRYQPVSEPDKLEALYLEFVAAFYEQDDIEQAEKIASRLEAALAASPQYASSIRGEEIRSLVAEFRGDLEEAARSREAEIRKILELHTLAANTSSWDYVSRQYDYSDVSDRLDLLAMLYDKQGQTERAFATLLESKSYCESHEIPFDAQSLLRDINSEMLLDYIREAGERTMAEINEYWKRLGLRGTPHSILNKLVKEGMLDSKSKQGERGRHYVA